MAITDFDYVDTSWLKSGYDTKASDFLHGFENQAEPKQSELLKAETNSNKISSFEGICDTNIAINNDNINVITATELPNHTHPIISKVDVDQQWITENNNTVTLYGVKCTPEFINGIFHQEFDVDYICACIHKKIEETIQQEYGPVHSVVKQRDPISYSCTHDGTKWYGNGDQTSFSGSIEHMSEQIKQHIDQQVLDQIVSKLHGDLESSCWPPLAEYCRGTTLTELSGSTDKMDHDDPFV